MRSQGRTSLALLAGALAAFAALSLVVLGFHLDGWDRAALHAVQHLHGPLLTAVMRRVTALGSWVWLLPLTLFAMLALAAARRGRAALFVGLSVGGAEALQSLAKVVFGRPRPSVFPPLDHVTSAAYPSGHAAVSAALVLALVATLWRTPWRVPTAGLGAAFVLAVSFSRIYLGVHYPSDVLGGFAAAAAWTAAVLTTMRTCSNRSPQS